MENVYLQSKNLINTVGNGYSFGCFDKGCVVGVIWGLIIHSTSNLSRSPLSSSETVCHQFIIRGISCLEICLALNRILILPIYLSWIHWFGSSLLFHLTWRSRQDARSFDNIRCHTACSYLAIAIAITIPNAVAIAIAIAIVISIAIAIAIAIAYL